MKRTFFLILIFLAAQLLLAPMVALFVFNLPTLTSQGELDMSVLASPPALGCSIIVSCAVVWAAMTLLKWTDNRSFRTCRQGKAAYLWAVLWMVPVIFIANLLLEMLPLEDFNQATFVAMAHDPWGVLALVLFGPFAEEMVFRMGIQRHLMRKVRPWGAIVCASLLFGVVHGNPAQIPGAVVLGMALGWLYWRSGSIWVPVSAHVFNNLAAVALIWAGQSESTLSQLCGGWLPASAAALLAAFAAYAGGRRLHRFFGEPRPTLSTRDTGKQA